MTKSSSKATSSEATPMQTSENLDPYTAILNRLICTTVDHKKNKNCITNPWCVHNLEDKQKGIWGSKHAGFLQLGYDPATSKRGLLQIGSSSSSSKLRPPICSPCGSINLGATCYMNALLQMIMQVLPFRDAVNNLEYDLTFSNPIDLVVRELQLAFKQMESGLKRGEILSFFT